MRTRSTSLRQRGGTFLAEVLFLTERVICR
jgi:hypothetical protein